MAPATETARTSPDKIWAHSGDSHFLEPDDLWNTILPAKQAVRMPRSEKIAEDEEIVHVDGESFHRKLPAMMTRRGADGLTIAELSVRPPGARDMRERLHDLDAEGIWGEVMYASLGLWSNLVKDQTLVREAARAQNEWMVSEIKGVAPDRLVPAAQMPLLSVDDAVAEIQHIASIGLHVASLPTGVAPGMPDWNDDSWEPLWAAAEEAGIVLGFHIGTDGGSPVVVPRPGWRRHQLRRDHLRGPEGGDQAGRVRRARPPSGSAPADLRRRGDVGSLPR